MKIKPVYIQIPENEYIRLKMYAVCHNQSIQMVVRKALSEYLKENAIKNKITKINDNE